ERHAHPSDFLESLDDRPLFLLDRRRLGNLEHQTTGRPVEPLEHVSYPPDEPRLLELKRGDIHRDLAELQALVAPRGKLRDRGFDNPGTELRNLTAPFGDRNELLRAHEPARRMRPAQKRFEPGDLAGMEIDLRLVIDEKVSRYRRLPQIRLELELS